MKDKIEQAKQQLGLNNAQLSVKLGYSSGYISRRLKNAPAPKTQELIKHRIDELLGESELSAVKKELEHKNQVLDKRNAELINARHDLDETVKKLNHMSNIRDCACDLNNKLINDLNSMEKTQASLRTVLNEAEHENRNLGISLLNKDARIKQLKKQISNERFVFGVLWISGLFILVCFWAVKNGW